MCGWFLRGLRVDFLWTPASIFSMWGSLDGGFFGGFRFDFLLIFESKLKGVGFIWGGWSGSNISLWGGFWHHFFVSGASFLVSGASF